jgi:hypothetical protein
MLKEKWEIRLDARLSRGPSTTPLMVVVEVAPTGTCYLQTDSIPPCCKSTLDFTVGTARFGALFQRFRTAGQPILRELETA